MLSPWSSRGRGTTLVGGPSLFYANRSPRISKLVVLVLLCLICTNFVFLATFFGGPSLFNSSNGDEQSDSQVQRPGNVAGRNVEPRPDKLKPPKDIKTQSDSTSRMDCLKWIGNRSVIVYRSRFTEPSGFAEESLQFLRILNSPSIQREFFVAAHNDGPLIQQFFQGMPPNVQAAYNTSADRARLRCANMVPHIHIHHGSAGDFGCAKGGHYCIGRTAYETDQVPEEWIPRLTATHELWVPSEFNVRTFSDSMAMPKGDPANVRAFPEPIDLEVFSPSRVEPFEGISALCGNSGPRFLSVFAWNDRKGWDVLLRAFFQEFQDYPGACLILRTYLKSAPMQNFVDKDAAIGSGSGGVRNRDANTAGVRLLGIIDRFSREVTGRSLDQLKSRVVVISQYLKHQELASLYKAADAFVLPTRGEGWGRPIMEAMAMGLPVAATGWGGHMDFLSRDTGYLIDYTLTDIDTTVAGTDSTYKGHKWAEPSVSHLREIMRYMATNRQEIAKQGLAAQRHIRMHYNEPVFRERLLSELRRVRELVSPLQRLSCDNKYDVVYTYVNGSIEHHADLKRHTWETLSKSAREAVDQGSALSTQRSRDLGELRYSLRSLELNAPWFNRVFIITETPPDWIDTSHPKLTIVHPDSILSRSESPSFNSHALEAAVHRIPGLSECYLYLCDDYFFGQLSSPSDWYDEDSRCFNVMLEFDRPSIASNSAARPPKAHDAAFKNSNTLLDSVFPKIDNAFRVRHFVPHAPHFFVKSIVQEIFPESFQLAMQETISHQFRSWNDIHMAYLFAHFLIDRSIHEKDVCVNVVETHERHHNHKPTDPTFTIYIPDAKRAVNFENAMRGLRKLRDSPVPPKFFSINDDMDAVGEANAIALYQAVLDKMFALPSSFEKTRPQPSSDDEH